MIQTVVVTLILIYLLPSFSIANTALSSTSLQHLMEMYWAKPNAKAVEALQRYSDPQIEKIKLHWRIQSALEDCVLKNAPMNELKKRILNGVQGAETWSVPCPVENLAGLDDLKTATSAITHSAEKKALDLMRMTFLQEMIGVRESLGDTEDLAELNSFCLKHECPPGAEELIQKHRQPKSLEPEKLIGEAWQALESYRAGQYIGSHQGLLLASTAHQIDLQKPTQFEDFSRRVPSAHKEVISQLKQDTYHLFKKIEVEENSSQRPHMVRNHLREIIEHYPTVVGSMLANNPEFTSLVCYELQAMEGPKSSADLEKDWLWLSGGMMLSAAAAVAVPAMGIPLTVGRIAQGVMAVTAVNSAIGEHTKSKELYRESMELRNEFFAGKGEQAILASADARAQEAYEKMQSSYIEAAQLVPVGRLSQMAKVFTVGKTGERSVEAMQSLKVFFESMVSKSASKVFRTNFTTVRELLVNSSSDFDLLMGTLAKLGPRVQGPWNRFIEKLPDKPKERVERLIALAKRKGCF